MKAQVLVLAVLGAVFGLLAAVALLVLTTTFFLPSTQVPSSAVEGVVVGPTHATPLTQPAVWSLVEVHRQLITNDNSGSKELLWKEVKGPSRITLRTSTGEVDVDPGDPWHAWRLGDRVSENYSTFSELPELVRKGRSEVPAGDFLSVRVFALHPGETVAVWEKDGHTERLWVGGRAAVTAARTEQEAELEHVRLALGSVAALLLLLCLGFLGTTGAVVLRSR